MAIAYFLIAPWAATVSSDFLPKSLSGMFLVLGFCLPPLGFKCIQSITPSQEIPVHLTKQMEKKTYSTVSSWLYSAWYEYHKRKKNISKRYSVMTLPFMAIPSWTQFFSHSSYRMTSPHAHGWPEGLSFWRIFLWCQQSGMFLNWWVRWPTDQKNGGNKLWPSHCCANLLELHLAGKLQ